MSLSICPAAIVAAPVETVWAIITDTERYDQWIDAHVERVVPPGPATPGQMVYLTSRAMGRVWNVTMHIDMVNPDKHQLRMLIKLPLGLVNNETISCTPIDATSCRVQYG